MSFIIVLIGWMFSLCLHEFSHAAVAYLGGDTSVREKGYLTFNPLRYTHPVYSLLMPMIFLLLGGIGLPGGAVYIDRQRLRGKRWEAAMSLAGPLSNLALALVLGLILRLAPAGGSEIWSALAFLAELQAVSVIFNLLPIPPLDGYHAVSTLLDPEWRATVDRLAPIIQVFFFLAILNVPYLSEMVWWYADGLAGWMGVPLDWAFEGYKAFLFWRK